MKNKYTNLEPISSKNIIIIGLGSTPILGVQNFRVLDMANCVDLQDYIKTIAFDAQNVEHNMCLPTVNKELQSVKLMPHEIISGKVGDKKSRLIAEKQGLFWMIEPGFHIDPGVLAENVGTGGDARFGHVLFVSNQNVFSSRFESCLRDCQDYQQQSGTNEKEGGVSTEQVIHVIIIVSFAGGTGNGSVWEVMHIVAQKTVELKINVR
ncbi:MAG: tubulin-like doman-containing protein, partial [Planctomycetota bacterium]